MAAVAVSLNLRADLQVKFSRGVYTRGEMVRDAPWQKVGGFFVNNDAFAIMYYYMNTFITLH